MNLFRFRRVRFFRRLSIAAILIALPATSATAIECPDKYDPLKNVYFGDLHTHTSYSLDAIVYGTNSTPADAYAFARGGAVDIAARADIAAGQIDEPKGYTFASQDRWLDFNAVTDHSEWLSTAYGCAFDPTSPFFAQNLAYCIKLVTPWLSPPLDYPAPCASQNDLTGTGCFDEQTRAWHEERLAADAANDPCEFTAFKAYEWTKEGDNSTLGNKESFHKNVIFKGAVTPALPFTALTHTTSQSLWAALSAECNGRNGCEAITIPHSLNQSNGQAFTISGYSATDLNRRMKYQRLVEVHQHKGNSECMSDTSDNGDVTTCDLELDTVYGEPQDEPGYARPAMELGLARFVAQGDNPVKVGFVGATDNHNAASGNVAESSWIGNLAAVDNTPEGRLADDDRRNDNPGGITGVWAEENTRASIFEALERREVFATSGTKITVRFYQVDGIADPCADPGFPADIVAAGGIAMGGTMGTRSTPPVFVVYATPDQTPLESIDFVKASISGGNVVEKVYAKPLPAAAPNPPGCIFWEDPDFQPGDPAFYYARVKEEETWRWSHYDCEAIKLAHPIGGPAPDWETLAYGCHFDDSTPKGLDYKIRERAWTSAIWYMPGGPVTVQTRTMTVRGGNDPLNLARSSFKFISRTRRSSTDHRIVVPDEGSDGDPTLMGGAGGGATLTIYNPDSEETVTHDLDASLWTSLGAGAGYVYENPNGPISVVSLRADKLSVIGGGSSLGFTLDEHHQDGIALRLQFGPADPWCAFASPRTTAALPLVPALTTPFDRPGYFRSAKDAPEPEQCPLVPGT